MEMPSGFGGRWNRWMERAGPAGVAVIGLAMGAGILILAQLAARPDPPDEAARAVCDDAVQRALTADTLLEFERARFVVVGMNCRLPHRIRDLYPTSRTAPGG